MFMSSKLEPPMFQTNIPHPCHRTMGAKHVSNALVRQQTSSPAIAMRPGQQGDDSVALGSWSPTGVTHWGCGEISYCNNWIWFPILCK